ncbi:hypothetical protein [Tenacibaculum sp. SG-28]|uniref:DUF7674 family protein n=1 Tax=Tenacibaculum sp. SG-28 TaxID=754426 RepID=UPI000CF528A4|nr:hypothetical protein [Tenacibaculum sp. SG-28]PQJ21250.1 hypothetical protein BSU00_09780 [Tenacibaculum sp. SG-28]
MKGENWINLDEGKMKPEEYFDLVMKEFPETKLGILEWESEMIHMRMETFAEYTIKQIENNDIDELKRCFEFQESKIELINSELENALNVSYCEALLLGDAADEMERITQYMSEKLKAEYFAYRKYYLDLVKSSE